MLQTLTHVLGKETKLAVGLMSGTSLDGIDAALVEISRNGRDTKVKLVAFETVSYSSKEREELLQLCSPETSAVDQICAWNVKLGHKFAQAALEVIAQAGLQRTDIDFISSHGQTIYHSPEKLATLQIGELAVIAEQTGILTVGDFRPNDLAAGGQGAPLVPFVDFLLFSSLEKGRILLNIGGIANLTVLPKSAQPEEIIAFDTGPGNMLIDAIVRMATQGQSTYDHDGQWASKGSINQLWLEKIIQEDSYLQRDIPKTTGREYYTLQKAQALYEEGMHQGVSIEDILATVTAYTSHSIAHQIAMFVDPQYDIAEIIVSGGGAHNSFLIRELQKAVQQQVLVMEDIQFSSDAKEAIAFVVLGNQFLHGLANNLPTATGAQRQVSMGKLVFPLKTNKNT